MKRWNMITTVDIQEVDEEGKGYVIPAGSTINYILWDGVTPFTPPENTKLIEITDSQET